jgi:hypothetical protein
MNYEHLLCQRPPGHPAEPQGAPSPLGTADGITMQDFVVHSEPGAEGPLRPLCRAPGTGGSQPAILEWKTGPFNSKDRARCDGEAKYLIIRII